MEGLTGYSVVPLRLFSLFGALMAVIGFLAGIAIVIHKIIEPNIAAGYTSTIAVILFCSGMLLLMLGLIGEYIGRIFPCNGFSPYDCN